MLNLYIRVTMQQPQLFFRIKMMRDFLAVSDSSRKSLMAELIDNAMNPIINMRRFRMLNQLSLYEHIVIKKIYELETNDLSDFLSAEFKRGVGKVVNRSG